MLNDEKVVRKTQVNVGGIEIEVKMQYDFKRIVC